MGQYLYKRSGYSRHIELAPSWMLELTDLKTLICKEILLILVFKSFCFPVITLPYITVEAPVSLSKCL